MSRQKTGQHTRREKPSVLRLTSSVGRRSALAFWSVICLILGAASSRWAPALITGSEQLIGVETFTASMSNTCGDGFIAAPDSSTVKPEEALALFDNEMPTLRQTGQQGLAGFEWSEFTITLTMLVDETATVTKTRMVLFKHTPSAVAWVAGFEEGCGGGALYSRDYAADLNPEPPVLKRKNDEGTTESTGFSVSQDDPAELDFTVNGCEGLYEFGIELQYRVRGTDHALWVGTAEEPLRLLGGEPKRVLELDPSTGEIREVPAAVAENYCQTHEWGVQTMPEADPESQAVEGLCARLKGHLTPVEYSFIGCGIDKDYEAAESAICSTLKQLASREELSDLGQCQGSGHGR